MGSSPVTTIEITGEVFHLGGRPRRYTVCRLERGLINAYHSVDLLLPVLKKLHGKRVKLTVEVLGDSVGEVR